ncbi:radical SAM protein [bacterium]|nr:radical SAM protein [bacterium]
MINISSLYTGQENASDAVRYNKPTDPRDIRPIVVLNLTRRCNLRCLHCYSDSDGRRAPAELSTDEVRALLDDLANYGVKFVLFSGGEPLTRPDIFTLAAHAARQGLRVTLSTNGTLITPKVAQKIAEAGFSYVGISFDGLGSVNDFFRGAPGAFEQAKRGMHHLKPVGVRVGLRLTLTRHTVDDLDNVLRFVEEEPISRACFYHLAYSGRGAELHPDDLPVDKRRAAIDKLCAAAKRFFEMDLDKEILTVDNHSDGPYIYLKLLAENRVRAAAVRERLERHGGARTSSGVGLAEIDWEGRVHADQFSFQRVFGNIRLKPFSEIWSNPEDPHHVQLRDRLSHLNGRCVSCRFLPMCGGGLRSRAEAATGDPWAPDPSCLLTAAEIAE